MGLSTREYTTTTRKGRMKNAITPRKLGRNPISMSGTSSVIYEDGWSYTYREPTQEEVDIIMHLLEVAEPAEEKSLHPLPLSTVGNPI